jgi:hypothetical protein
MPLDLWGNEIVVEPKPTKKKRQRTRERYRRGPNPEYFDMTLWFSKNRPKTLAECDDLRRTLRTKSMFGKYCHVDYGSEHGRSYIGVRGPASLFLFVSPAARRQFNKRLDRIEEIIGIYLRQFGTEQPVFQKSRPLVDLD